jgi:uncharacterized membrane protein
MTGTGSILAFNLGVYHTIVFIHVLAAVAWVGGDILLQVFGVRIQRANDPERMSQFGLDVEFVGLRFIMPLSVVLILAAIALIWYGPYGLSALWVKLAIVGYLITLVTGAAVLGPTSGKIGRLLQTKAPDDPEVTSLLSRLLLVSRLDLIVLILLVADMVFKPGA